MSSLHTERRMALLFVVVLALLAWQATRLERLRPSPIRIAAEVGTQVYPVAVPPGPLPTLPPAGDDRRLALEQRSVTWPGAPDAAGSGDSPCHLFVPVSTHHWVRRPVSADAHRDGIRLAISSRDLLDDDDGDGDLLDAGELVPARGSAPSIAEIHCETAVQ